MFEAKYYETYYFCNVIRNVLNDQFNYARGLNDFLGDGRIFYLVTNFAKQSLLHEFIAFVVEEIYWERIYKFDPDNRNELFIEHALKYHSISHVTYQEFLRLHSIDNNHNSVEDYINGLQETGGYEKLIQQTVDEVFYVLFQNRALLLEFNELLASMLEIEPELPNEVSHLFTKRGKLKRRNIPKWVQRAVFFRDRGSCVICNKDISGLVSLNSKENFDHIVPLARYGFNDVTNIQLLCKECNQLEKRDGESITSSNYENWY